MFATTVLLLASDAVAGPLDALAVDVPGCEATRAYCFDVRVHVPLDDHGAPTATAEWIAGQLAAANKHFADVDVAFQVASVHALPASARRVEDRKERDSFGTRLGTGVIDFFVTGHLDDVDTAGVMIYGVTWRKGTRKFVIVSTQAWERTLTHELGHFFGLPHSTYPISLMNKTERKEPPPEQRRFADEEFVKMGPRVKALVRSRVLANRKRK